MNYPKITVVTVNYNLGKYLEECICSVINQGYPNLEYIIVDGGSTDGSVEIIKKYEKHLAWWVSEPDGGHYAAVQKGFAKSTGDIMAWLNSDDKYHHKSLFAVANIFNAFPRVKWLTGFPTEYTESGQAVKRISLPWARWSKLRYYTFDFQFIQQESTFWRRELWEKAGGSMNLDYSLAGDMELWARFFRHEKLYTAFSQLSGFRYRYSNQRSRDHLAEYLAECAQVVRRELGAMPWLKRTALRVLRPFGLLIGVFFFFDVPLLRGIYRRLYGIPPVIRYDFGERKYLFSERRVKHPPLFFGGKQFALRK